MKLEKRIELCDSMTPLESEIASYILNNKDAVTKLKIQELADILFISKSAIHRFVKKIGFNGFNDLKVSIAKENADLLENNSYINVNYPFQAKDNPRQIAFKLLELYEKAIKDTFEYVDLDQIKAVSQEMLEHSLMEYETIGTRGQQVKETENKLFELYKNPNLDHKPEELSKRGGAYYSDAACECINAIYNNKQTHMVVSTKNRGAIPELPEDSIVEVSCYIGAKGAMPVAWGKLPSAQRGWLQCMKAMEECTIEAAVTGNYGLALEAFTLNELIPSGENAKRVLDELLIAHKNYLPQFKSTIEKLEKENVTIKDSVVNEIIAHER